MRYKLGFTCSSFDLLHAGHVLMLQDCMSICDQLVLGLQTDPTLDRPDTKNKPVQEVSERLTVLKALIRERDWVVVYSTEASLLELLKKVKPDVRILGSDWRGKPFTGHELEIPIHWHERTHDYSTSALRARVYDAEVARRAVT